MLRTLSTLPRSVRIVEVGPRDGLQNEKAIIPTAQKIQFIQMLADAGLPVVEATSFVSPRAIPQLSDASEVMANLSRRSSTSYPVLIPNLRGMERALAAGVRTIAVFTAASESFTRHNINATIAESLANYPWLHFDGVRLPLRGESRTSPVAHRSTGTFRNGR